MLGLLSILLHYLTSTEFVVLVVGFTVSIFTKVPAVVDYSLVMQLNLKHCLC